MTYDHENPICASLGHYVCGITLAYCPHRMAWVAVVRAGDESDDLSWRMDRLEFGPFDGLPEVEAHAIRELQRLLRTDLRGWLGLQGAPEAPGTPPTGG